MMLIILIQIILTHECDWATAALRFVGTGNHDTV